MLQRYRCFVLSPNFDLGEFNASTMDTRSLSGSSIGGQRKPTYAWQLLRASCEADYEMILNERKSYLANSCDLSVKPKLLAEWMALIEELDTVARQNLGVDDTGYVYFETQPKEESRRRSKSFLNLFKVANTKPAPTLDATTPSRRPRSNSFRGFLTFYSSKRRLSSSATTSTAVNTKGGRRYMPQSPSNSADGRAKQTPTKTIASRGIIGSPPSEVLEKQRKLSAALQLYKTRRLSDSGSAISGRNGVAPSSLEDMEKAARAEAEARFLAERGSRPSTQLHPTRHAHATVELLASNTGKTVSNAALEVLLELKKERASLAMPTMGTLMAWV
eukprot:m.162276 g.162276  ORF g.162276 m.162276 type:complete len:332 (-) comp31272_c0_seq1:92-1087(-)